MTLVACDQKTSPQEHNPRKQVVTTDWEIKLSARDDTRLQRLPPPTPTISDAAKSDMNPSLLTPEAERSIKGARNLVLIFASAIENDEYDQAWALLSPADKQKWDGSAFAEIFAELEEVTVAVPAGSTEGAAGSLYYTAPITITAFDQKGRPVRIEGDATLRRVNDVNGATPAQRRWHFETLILNWVH